MHEFSKPFIITLSEKNVSCQINRAFWIPCSAKFLSLCSTPSKDGKVIIFEIQNGKIEQIHEVASLAFLIILILLKSQFTDVFLVFHFQESMPKSFLCGTFKASSVRNRHLATGDGSGNLNIWFGGSLTFCFVIY